VTEGDGLDFFSVPSHCGDENGGIRLFLLLLLLLGIPPYPSLFLPPSSRRLRDAAVPALRYPFGMFSLGVNRAVLIVQ
jgi:hypothetical protein